MCSTFNKQLVRNESKATPPETEMLITYYNMKVPGGTNYITATFLILETHCWRGSSWVIKIKRINSLWSINMLSKFHGSLPFILL